MTKTTTKIAQLTISRFESASRATVIETKLFHDPEAAFCRAWHALEYPQFENADSERCSNHELTQAVKRMQDSIDFYAINQADRCTHHINIEMKEVH